MKLFQKKKLEISSNKSQLKRFIPKLFQQETEIHPFDSHDSRIVLLLMHTCKKLSNDELPFRTILFTFTQFNMKQVNVNGWILVELK